jgi:hypothetical protein
MHRKQRHNDSVPPRVPQFKRHLAREHQRGGDKVDRPLSEKRLARRLGLVG